VVKVIRCAKPLSYPIRPVGPTRREVASFSTVEAPVEEECKPVQVVQVESSWFGPSPLSLAMQPRAVPIVHNRILSLNGFRPQKYDLSPIIGASPTLHLAPFTGSQVDPKRRAILVYEEARRVPSMLGDPENHLLVFGKAAQFFDHFLSKESLHEIVVHLLREGERGRNDYDRLKQYDFAKLAHWVKPSHQIRFVVKEEPECVEKCTEVMSTSKFPHLVENRYVGRVPHSVRNSMRWLIFRSEEGGVKCE
jgi:hypothetical protein